MLPELPSLQGIPAHSPPPSCGACPAPAHATQRRAPPGSWALWAARKSRAHGGAAGGGCWDGTKRPFEFPSMLPLLSSPLEYFSLLHSLNAGSHSLDRSGGSASWHGPLRRAGVSGHVTPWGVRVVCDHAQG